MLEGGNCLITERGYLVLFRSGEANHCPGCGGTSWDVRATTAECGRCGTALEIDGCSRPAGQRVFRGSGGDNLRSTPSEGSPAHEPPTVFFRRGTQRFEPQARSAFAPVRRQRQSAPVRGRAETADAKSALTGS